MGSELGQLGIGSGFLTNDMLNEFKRLMEVGTVAPIQKTMQQNLDKQKALTEIITLVEDLNTKTKKFADLDTYMKRKATVTGEGVTATVGNGVLAQDIKLEVHQLAKNDVTQFGKKFESRDSVFTNQNTTLKFNHNGKDYAIDIRAGQTVAEVSQAITDATDGAVAGVIMKTGGSQPYQLMIQSKETGENNRVYFGNTVTSGIVAGGALKGDFNITVKDSQGKDKTINVNLDTPNANTSQDNAGAIKKAIEEAISKDEDLKKLYDDGILNVGLVNDGKGFVINDRRGGDITIAAGSGEGSEKLLKDIGLTAGTTSSGTDAFTSSTSIQGGKFEGKITIGNVTIDLAEVTKAGNSGEENLQAIVKKINDESKGEYKAEAKNGQLVVNKNDGGAVQIVFNADNSKDQNAKIISGLGITAGNHIPSQDFLKDIGITKIQTAQDSKFSWNGIEISRSKNSIDDVVSGITVELTKEHKDGDHAVIRIGRDDEDIFKGIDEFVEAYNALMTKVEEHTRFDEDTKISGIFNGESTIRGIQSTLRNILNFTAGSSRGGMSDYGFSLNDEGKLTVDKEKLEKAYKDDPEKALAFFKGGEVIIGGTEIKVGDDKFEHIGGTKTEIKGFFTQFQEALDGLVTKKGNVEGTLKAYESSLKSEYKKSEDEKKVQQERVDKRIDGMRERMVKYDAMINELNQQMTKLQNIINASSGK